MLRDRATRLSRWGPAVLDDWELLSLVLSPGPWIPRERTSRMLLAELGSLDEVVRTPAPVLRRDYGLTPGRIERLIAAVELGVRASRPPRRSPLIVNGPADLAILLEEEFHGLDRERFLALYLDSRHRVQTVETVSIGSLNASLVHPREVFKPAVALSAAAVIVAHNHPSGNSSPSGDDLDLTARLDRCGHLLGIDLLDHLVVGDGEITSIREYGWPDLP